MTQYCSFCACKEGEEPCPVFINESSINICECCVSLCHDILEDISPSQVDESLIDEYVRLNITDNDFELKTLELFGNQDSEIKKIVNNLLALMIKKKKAGQ